MDDAMYLSSYSFIEPEEPLYIYYPGWLNVWESHLYKNALKATGANGWGFKRFGSLQGTYTRETLRKPNYIAYIDAMEKASDAALQSLATRERMQLLKMRTAFIYADSWGEAGIFENNVSALHVSSIDTLPKNIVKKFSVKDVTCKIRGEKYSFLQAMRMAQDYLSWNVFDFVIICCAWRSVPLLTFSSAINQAEEKIKSNDCNINLSIERVGCFIFSKNENKFKIQCGSNLPEQEAAVSVDLTFYANGYDPIYKTTSFPTNVIDLVSVYGDSGCLTPALSWQYITERGLHSGKSRTIVTSRSDEKYYFDTWF